MDLSQCFYLGYVSRVIGSEGRCEIKLDVDQPSDYKKLESVLILMNSKDQTPVPFFIQRVIEIHGNQIKVELADNQWFFGILGEKSICQGMEEITRWSGWRNYKSS